MKLTSLEHTGPSQLIPGVRWTMRRGVMRNAILLMIVALALGTERLQAAPPQVAAGGRRTRTDRVVRHHHVQPAAIQGVLREALQLGVCPGAGNRFGVSHHLAPQHRNEYGAAVLADGKRQTAWVVA
jgi:hypothetical protein